MSETDVIIYQPDPSAVLSGSLIATLDPLTRGWTISGLATPEDYAKALRVRLGVLEVAVHACFATACGVCAVVQTLFTKNETLAFCTLEFRFQERRTCCQSQWRTPENRLF